MGVTIRSPASKPAAAGLRVAKIFKNYKLSEGLLKKCLKNLNVTLRGVVEVGIFILKLVICMPTILFYCIVLPILLWVLMEVFSVPEPKLNWMEGYIEPGLDIII